MGGAKALANLCDSIIGLARTRNGMRYVKPLKTRMVRDAVESDALDYFSITDEPYVRCSHEGRETEMRLLYGKKRQEFFSEIWGDDKTVAIPLRELIGRIVGQDDSDKPDKVHNARSRIDAAVRKGVLRKDEKKNFYLNKV